MSHRRYWTLTIKGNRKEAHEAMVARSLSGVIHAELTHETVVIVEEDDPFTDIGAVLGVWFGETAYHPSGSSQPYPYPSGSLLYWAPISSGLRIGLGGTPC